MDAPANMWVDSTKSQSPEAIAQARAILHANIYCTLSTCSVECIPWVSPLFFAFDNRLNIYWSSATTSQHSQNLYSNRGRGAIAIFNSDFPEGHPEGLYFSGIASEIGGKDTELGLQLIKARARKASDRAPSDYLDESPRRMYRFQPQAAWLTGERILFKNQLIDTRISLNLANLTAIV